MKASVILPTKDRGPAIAETIESLIALDFPQDEWEILIVDNLSNPENQKQLQSFQYGRRHIIKNFTSVSVTKFSPSPTSRSWNV